MAPASSTAGAFRHLARCGSHTHRTAWRLHPAGSLCSALWEPVRLAARSAESPKGVLVLEHPAGLHVRGSVERPSDPVAIGTRLESP